MSNEPPDLILSEALAKGVDAQLKAQADLPPTIIHTLQVLLDPASYPSAHVQWVRDGVRAILANWERAEDPEQLKRDLGLTGPKRRKSLTTHREIAIADAIVVAALAGNADPEKIAAEQLAAVADPGANIDATKRVERAWHKWGPVFLARLELAAAQVSAHERPEIRAAIDILKSQDRK